MPSPRSRPILAAAALLLVVPAGAPAIQAQTLQNDIGPYTVQGQVTTPGGDPAGQARVTLIPADSDAGERETQTGPQGDYRFTSLPEGRYHLVADHDCCGPRFEPVEASGTGTTENVDARLSEAPGPEADVTLVVYGRTVNLDDEPVPDVGLHVSYRGEDRQRRTLETRSGPNGTYAFEIRPERGQLDASRDGYDVTEAEFELSDGNEAYGERELTVPLRQSTGNPARIDGIVETPDGEPVEGASVEARPDGRYCEHEPCARPVEDRAEDRIERDNVTFRIEPEGRGFDRDRTDARGAFELTVEAGRVTVTARASDHSSTRRTMELAEGENRSATMTLTPIPEDSVVVRGTLTDARTGEAVEAALVAVENQRWRDTDRTRTADDGSFEFETKPGYAVLRASTEGCIPVRATAVDSAEAGSDEAPSSPSAVAVSPCQDVQRERSYFTRTTTFVGQADETERVDLQLTPRPGESATIEGWAVNASNGTGIPGARLVLENEWTGDRGRAQADEDGSFSIDVTPGYYTVLARAEDHFVGVANVEVASEATERVAVDLEPGTPHRSPCCVVYDAHATADAAQAANGTRETATEPPASSVEEAQAVDGASTFVGSGGSLGPYDAARLDAGDDTGSRAAPGPGLGLLAGLAVLVALLRRRP